MIPPDLLAVLANPLEEDRPPVVQKGGYLVCTKTGVGFPVIDGIPRMLPEDAIPAERIEELLNGPN